jgi:hypothetical protein
MHPKEKCFTAFCDLLLVNGYVINLIYFADICGCAWQVKVIISV